MNTICNRQTDSSNVTAIGRAKRSADEALYFSAQGRFHAGCRFGAVAFQGRALGGG
jgi:hypothetical protein